MKKNILLFFSLVFITSLSAQRYDSETNLKPYMMGQRLSDLIDKLISLDSVVQYNPYGVKMSKNLYSFDESSKTLINDVSDWDVNKKKWVWDFRNEVRFNENGMKKEDIWNGVREESGGLVPVQETKFVYEYNNGIPVSEITYKYSNGDWIPDNTINVVTEVDNDGVIVAQSDNKGHEDKYSYFADNNKGTKSILIESSYYGEGKGACTWVYNDKGLLISVHRGSATIETYHYDKKSNRLMKYEESVMSGSSMKNTCYVLYYYSDSSTGVATAINQQALNEATAWSDGQSLFIGGDVELASVQVYTIAGSLILSQKGDSKTIQLPDNVQKGILLVRIVDKVGNVNTFKVVIK